MTRTRKRTVLGLFGLGLFATVAACSKADKVPPVATVSFSSNKSRVVFTSPVEFTYRFDVAQDAKISGDYRVFVHVVDADLKILFYDDHDPVPPTSQWKPGQTVTYTRTRFIPVVPYLGEVTVQVGLVKGGDDERLPLSGNDPADRASTERAYKVGTLQLLPLSDAVHVIKKNGWHPTEFAADDPMKEWSWTQKTAVMTFRNPRKDLTFYLQYDARPDVFDRPQQVSVYSGNKLLSKFDAVSTELTLERIPISVAQLGTNEMAEIRVEVDRTFVPANLPARGKDLRELGIRIYQHYFEPK